MILFTLTQRGLSFKASLVLLLVIALTGCGTTSSLELAPQSKSSAVQEPLLVVIDDPRTERRKRGGGGPGYSTRLAYQDDPALHRAAAAIADDHGVEILLEWPLRNINAHCFVIEQPDQQILLAIKEDKRVRWVQPLNSFELQNAPVKKEKGDSANFDSITERFLSQVDERGENIKIAVIDTSIDRKHPDLADSRISVENFAGDRGEYLQEAHGTAVVGLIAANDDSQSGVSGLANAAEIHVLRACWQEGGQQGQCNTLTLSLALDAAIDIGVDIVNLSLTGPRDRVLNALLSRLVEQKTLIVAAYDETRVPEARFPAPQDGVVYAYGLDPVFDTPSGDDILYAPRHALSLTPSAGYDIVSGHSIAAPQITAMAACLMNRHAGSDRAQILTHLKEWLGSEQSAVPLSSQTVML